MADRTPVNAFGNPPAFVVGFGGVKVTKGRIVLPATRAAHEFMFNPTEVTRSHAWEWGKQSPFGHSHKMLQGGCGSDETIAFKLMIDGDRGRMEKRRAQGQGGGFSQNDVPLDISDEINFYLSLTHPMPVMNRLGPGAYSTGASPPTFVLTMGTMFTKVNAVMESVGVTVTQFTPQMEPWCATLDVKILVKADVPVYATDVYQGTDPDAADDIAAVLHLTSTP